MPMPAISTSKAAAAVINAMISLVGLAVSIAPLSLGADGVAERSDQPPFAALVVGVVLGVLGVVATDAAARVDVAAWCRMTGHEYVGEEVADDGVPRYVVRRVG